MFFDPCRPYVEWYVIQRIHEAIVGMNVAPTIASCIYHIMVMSTRQGSIPFAPFAGGGDTLVAAAVLRAARLVLWCVVGVGHPKLS